MGGNAIGWLHIMFQVFVMRPSPHEALWYHGLICFIGNVEWISGIDGLLSAHVSAKDNQV